MAGHSGPLLYQRYKLRDEAACFLKIVRRSHVNDRQPQQLQLSALHLRHVVSQVERLHESGEQCELSRVIIVACRVKGERRTGEGEKRAQHIHITLKCKGTHSQLCIVEQAGNGTDTVCLLQVCQVLCQAAVKTSGASAAAFAWAIA